MKCDEIQIALSLYDDDALTLSDRLACDDHLRACPVCRAELAELRSLTRSLGRLTPAPPADDLANVIGAALAIEAGVRMPSQSWRTQLALWLRPRFVPYAVSSFASIALFIGMFAGLRPHVVALHEAQLASERTYHDINRPISPQNYAALRAPFSGQSPSLDPDGALAAMTRSAPAISQDNAEVGDDMIVVADVYGNGSASLASVVNPPRDPRMLDEFQAALRKNAAFVPASLDGRPGTMRVVFSVQKVDVLERSF